MHRTALVALVANPVHRTALVALVATPVHRTALVALVANPVHRTALVFLVANPVHCTDLLSHNMRFPTMWYVQLGKAQISLCTCSLIRAFASRINICVLSYTDKT